jgi:hypothetical protein
MAGGLFIGINRFGLLPMNPAPAELLQLLTIAALQPTTSGHSPITSAALSHRCPYEHEKKKPPCLKTIRQCGLFFSLRLCACWIESASHYEVSNCSLRLISCACGACRGFLIRSVFFAREHAKNSMFTF